MPNEAGLAWNVDLRSVPIVYSEAPRDTASPPFPGNLQPQLTGSPSERSEAE